MPELVMTLMRMISAKKKKVSQYTITRPAESMLVAWVAVDESVPSPITRLGMSVSLAEPVT